MGETKRGRGRPRREHHIRVRAERRTEPDYAKLARALLEHAAIQQALEDEAKDPTASTLTRPDESDATDQPEGDQS